MRLLDWLKHRMTAEPLGARGEALAARHLKRKLGMKILARNVRCPGGELDIVALDGDDLVVVEVRTRSSEQFTTPEATITSYKKRFLNRAAHWYIRRRQLEHWVVRFDIVAVVWPVDGKPVLRYHRNAFGFRTSRSRH